MISIKRDPDYPDDEFTLSKKTGEALSLKFVTVGIRIAKWNKNRPLPAEASLKFIVSKRVSWLNLYAYNEDVQPVITIKPACHQLMNLLRITFYSTALS